MELVTYLLIGLIFLLINLVSYFIIYLIGFAAKGYSFSHKRKAKAIAICWGITLFLIFMGSEQIVKVAMLSPAVAYAVQYNNESIEGQFKA